MPNPGGQQIWGQTRPVTVPFKAGAALQPIFANRCRLLSLQLNNPGGAVDTVTLWDGGNSAGNDRLAVLVAAGGAFQAALMDVGIPFENGIAISMSVGTTNGYALIADDDGS